MKKIFEFTMPEDKSDYEMFSQSWNMFGALADMRSELRSICKHGKPTNRDIYWQDKFYEILKDHEVNLDG
jgi:hypothetical protein